MKEKGFIVPVVGSVRTGEGFLNCLGNQSSPGMADTRFFGYFFTPIKSKQAVKKYSKIHFNLVVGWLGAYLAYAGDKACGSGSVGSHRLFYIILVIADSPDSRDFALLNFLPSGCSDNSYYVT